MQFIEDLYTHLLRRSPSSTEIQHWVRQMDEGLSERAVFYRFISSSEYQATHRIRLPFPIGHFHSPIVDPDEARKYVPRDRNMDPGLLPGLTLSLAGMEEFWASNGALISRTPFAKSAGSSTRYYYDNAVYPIGDATIYRLMILHHRPKRIIEVGSGFSSAAALDAIDESEQETQLTCIEPDPTRLFGLIRPSDRLRIRVMEDVVQAVPLSTFDQLEEHDILFIDSTHVVKTGSDVNHELFSVLPRLKPGVVIQIHDILYPFEYPDEWVYAHNYSWNEIYAIRAFLMHNHDYRVDFFNDLFARKFVRVIEQVYPTFLLNPGGGIWLTKTGPRSETSG